ncbi:MAG: hypothetical protein R2849_07510 [Thermomicrobiales bacterium]
MIIWTGLLLIAVISQIGLGYSARNNVSLLSWHIPSGVAIFGFAGRHAARVRFALQAGRRLDLPVALRCASELRVLPASP